MIKTHKRTKQRLLMETQRDVVSTLFILDEYDNRVLYNNSLGKPIHNVDGTPYYKMAVCLNDNLE